MLPPKDESPLRPPSRALSFAARALLVLPLAAGWGSLAVGQAPVTSSPAPAASPAPMARPAMPSGEDASSRPQPCGGTYSGRLNADLPFNTTVGKPFAIDVSLEPCPGHEKDSVELRMEQTNAVSYEPRVFRLKPGEWETVEATVLQASGGLAEVMISAAGNWAPPLSVTLDAGFSSTNVKANIDQTLESHVVYPVALSFVDDEDKVVSLGGPVTIQLMASRAALREVGSKEWRTRVEYRLDSGANSTLPVELRAQGVTPQTGLLSATLVINDSRILRRQQFGFRIVPQWWIQLLMGVLGGLLHSVYSLFVDRTVPRRTWSVVVGARVVTGIFAGLLAYLLAAWNVLGIQVDTTSLRAYVILGFLFSYVGLDALMKRLLAPAKEAPVAPGGTAPAAGST